MSNLDMQSMVNVIADVNELIAKYGINVVNHAMRYVNEFPVQAPVVKIVRFGKMFDLSEADFNKVNTAYDNGRGKIMAIKQLREVTGCGLKEAKDAFETHYGYVPSNW